MVDIIVFVCVSFILIQFFTRQGVHGVLKPHELFNQVTGLKLKPGNQNEFLAQVGTNMVSTEIDKSNYKIRLTVQNLKTGSFPPIFIIKYLKLDKQISESTQISPKPIQSQVRHVSHALCKA